MRDRASRGDNKEGIARGDAGRSSTPGSNLVEFSITLSPVKGEEPAEAPPSDPLVNFDAPAERFRLRATQLFEFWAGVGGVVSTSRASNLSKFAPLLADIRARAKAVHETTAPIAELVIEWKYPASSGGEAKVERRKCAVHEVDHLEKVLSFQRSQRVADRILNESILQQIVNTFEFLLADLLYVYYASAGDRSLDTLSISYKDLLSFSSLDEAKRYALDAAVEQFTRSGSLEDHIKKFKELFSVDVASLCANRYKELRETFLRRHLVVHGNGRVTSTYQSALRSMRLPATPEFSAPPTGHIIELDSSYIRNAWTAMVSVGAIVGHAWRYSLQKDQSERSGFESADNELNLTAYECLRLRQYPAAFEILSYAVTRPLKSEAVQQMALINLAQTLIWMGRVSESREVLSRRDWSTCSSVYRLCVATLTEDLAAFQKELALCRQEGSIDSVNLCEWPVFQKVRGDSRFVAVIRKCLGRDALAGLGKSDWKLIDPNPQVAMPGLAKQKSPSSKKKRRTNQATPRNDR